MSITIGHNIFVHKIEEFYKSKNLKKEKRQS